MPTLNVNVVAIAVAIDGKTCIKAIEKPNGYVRNSGAKQARDPNRNNTFRWVINLSSWRKIRTCIVLNMIQPR
jgi:hypothetical protein